MAIDRNMGTVAERHRDEAPYSEGSTLPAALEELVSRFEGSNSALHAAYENMRSLEETKAELSRQLALANSNISALHAEVEHAMKERQECQNALDASRRLVDNLQTQLSQKSEVNDALEESAKTLREELKTAWALLQKANAQVQALKEGNCRLVQRYKIPRGSGWYTLPLIVKPALDGSITEMTVDDPYMDQPHQRKYKRTDAAPSECKITTRYFLKCYPRGRNPFINLPLLEGVGLLGRVLNG